MKKNKNFSIKIGGLVSLGSNLNELNAIQAASEMLVVSKYNEKKWVPYIDDRTKIKKLKN